MRWNNVCDVQRPNEHHPYKNSPTAWALGALWIEAPQQRNNIDCATHNLINFFKLYCMYDFDSTAFPSVSVLYIQTAAEKTEQQKMCNWRYNKTIFCIFCKTFLASTSVLNYQLNKWLWQRRPREYLFLILFSTHFSFFSVCVILSIRWFILVRAHWCRRWVGKWNTCLVRMWWLCVYSFSFFSLHLEFPTNSPLESCEYLMWPFVAFAHRVCVCVCTENSTCIRVNKAIRCHFCFRIPMCVICTIYASFR